LKQRAVVYFGVLLKCREEIIIRFVYHQNVHHTILRLSLVMQIEN